MPQIGPLEVAVILLVALVVFGPTKLPELGKQAARGLREFREFQSGLRSDLAGMLDTNEHDVDDRYEPADPDLDAHELDPAPPVTREPSELEAGAGDGDASPPDPPAAPEASSREGPPADSSQ